MVMKLLALIAQRAGTWVQSDLKPSWVVRIVVPKIKLLPDVKTPVVPENIIRYEISELFWVSLFIFFGAWMVFDFSPVSEWPSFRSPCKLVQIKFNISDPVHVFWGFACVSFPKVDHYPEIKILIGWLLPDCEIECGSLWKRFFDLVHVCGWS